MLDSQLFQVPMIQRGTEKTISILGSHINEVISDVMIRESLSTFLRETTKFMNNIISIGLLTHSNTVFPVIKLLYF